MENCSKQPYAVHAVVFWAIERAYNESWSKHTPGMAEPYRTYAQRWGSEGFSAYVGQLEALADEALAAASSAER
jgi:thiaminase/transcriptional activator TenA